MRRRAPAAEPESCLICGHTHRQRLCRVALDSAASIDCERAPQNGPYRGRLRVRRLAPGVCGSPALSGQSAIQFGVRPAGERAKKAKR